MTQGSDGAELLDDIRDFMGKYLAFPTQHHLTVLTLWAVHTWCLSAFYVTPRLVLDSPEPGSGKTRVLEVLALVCRDAKLTVSSTTAALYRRIAAAEDQPPTILQDEADAVFGKGNTPQTEDLRALYNSGYKRGATVDRCEGDSRSMQVREFPVFAPVALAGLAGRLPRTIIDRAVVLHMRRRAPHERVAEFRGRVAADEAKPLRMRVQNWSEVNLGDLGKARPQMPDGVLDRPAEVWEALLAIADAAGGDWPERARSACGHFVFAAKGDEALSQGVRLLRDIREVMGERDRIFSGELVCALSQDPESEWHGDVGERPLTQRLLAKTLRLYGVESQQIRSGKESRKGYLVDGDKGLRQAWLRYLPEQKRNNRSMGNIAAQSVSLAKRKRNIRNTSETAETGSELQESQSVSDVSAVSHTSSLIESAEGMVSPSGPGRCEHCGLHVPTQGHREVCPANPCQEVPA